MAGQLLARGYMNACACIRCTAKADWTSLVKAVAQDRFAARCISWCWAASTHTVRSCCAKLSFPKKPRFCAIALGFVYVPRHGSWLNMAKIETNGRDGPASEPAYRQHPDCAKRRLLPDQFTQATFWLKPAVCSRPTMPMSSCAGCTRQVNGVETLAQRSVGFLTICSSA